MTRPSSVEHLADRQAALGEFRRRLAAEGPEWESLSRLPEGPWISISTELGSHGRAVAQGIGNHLGWKVYDHELLQTISSETHTREKVLSRLDDRAVGVIEEILSHLLVPGDPGQMSYLRELGRLVSALARGGHAVFLGRGVNWLLAPRYGLRVRVIAPMSSRIATVAAERGIGESEAREAIEKDDRRRAAFVRQIFHREIDDPLGYDLIVNLEGLDIGTAVQTLMTALPRKLAGSH